MLCCIVLCRVVSCHAMSHYVMLYYVTLSYVMPVPYVLAMSGPYIPTYL